MQRRMASSPSVRPSARSRFGTGRASNSGDRHDVRRDLLASDPKYAHLLERWDAVNNAFYPLVTPTESNAAVPVESSSTDDEDAVTARLAEPADLGEPLTESPAPAEIESSDAPAEVTPSGGRHRAPENENADSDTTPESTPSEGGRHRLTGSGRHSAEPESEDSEPSDTSSDADTSTPAEYTSDVSDTDSDTSSDSSDAESGAAA